MADKVDQTKGKANPAAMRDERRKAALKANMARRKAQARHRSAAQTETGQNPDDTAKNNE